MIIQALDLTNFRNIESASLTFSETFNVIRGRNAQGKTNLLEAIHLFSLGRSFRTRRGEEMISTQISPTAFIRLRGVHEGNGFKRTAVGPGQGVFVRYGTPPPLSPEALYEQLTGQQRPHRRSHRQLG